jgi:hypothetical protein
VVACYLHVAGSRDDGSELQLRSAKLTHTHEGNAAVIHTVLLHVRSPNALHKTELKVHSADTKVVRPWFYSTSRNCCLTL